MDVQAITFAMITVSLLVLVVVLYMLYGIHKLVNSRLTVALDEKERLEREVEKRGGPTAPPPRGQDDK